MGKYTDECEERAYAISPEDENYREELIMAAAAFRSRDAVLAEYMAGCGYDGDPEDTEEKLAYLKQLFAGAGIVMPKKCREYFTEHKPFDRGTAYLFAFAFGLSPEETDRFFSACCLGRGIDVHSMEEAVFYYCLRQRLSYEKAEELISRVSPQKQGSLEEEDDILYTETILTELSSLEDEEALVTYLDRKRDHFGYNHASAIFSIKRLWEEIAGGEESLIRREAALVGKRIKEKPSLDEVWLRILGLDGMEASDPEMQEIRRLRSLQGILKDNDMIHPLAEASFPDRNSIRIILSGGHVSYDKMHKVLVLLLFYRFWVRKALKHRDGTFAARPGEAERCLDEINRHLASAGYGPLYYGNPYDWIFLYAIQGDNPLGDFRGYMEELYWYSKDQHSERIG